MTFHVETAAFNTQGLIHRDSVGLNLILLVAGVAAGTLFSGIRLSKRCVRLAAAAVLAGTAAWGVAWVLSVRSLPYADGHDIMVTLQDVIAGKKPAENAIYFQKFPFQSGYALYAESLLRLFGPERIFVIPAANVLSAVLAEAALLHVTERLFHDTRITFLTVLLVLLCVQPVLFSAHFYGNMPGLMLAAWRQFADEIGAAPGKGTPMAAHLVMGGQEINDLNPGWFNGYTYDIYEDNGGDGERMRAQLRRDLAVQLEQWRQDPAERVQFYVRKTITQWNEPTFQSIWISQVSYRDVELNGFESSMLFGRGRVLYETYCNQYVQLVYTLFAGALLLLIGKPVALERLVLPLWIFGAFLYHFFFEAQSQYAVMYIPMMLPYAAFAAASLRKRLFGRKAEAPES